MTETTFTSYRKIPTTVLRCITQKAALHFGVYAEVRVPGRIKRGDSVTVVDQGGLEEP